MSATELYNSDRPEEHMGVKETFSDFLAETLCLAAEKRQPNPEAALLAALLAKGDLESLMAYPQCLAAVFKDANRYFQVKLV